jgi:predicted RNA-binding Zn-ribbon protein involved in translation (DUF1610 family)
MEISVQFATFCYRKCTVLAFVVDHRCGNLGQEIQRTEKASKNKNIYTVPFVSPVELHSLAKWPKGMVHSARRIAHSERKKTYVKLSQYKNTS